MAYDLRDFVEDLKKAGELVEINDEADWNYEISAYEVISGRFAGPAFLFNNIKGIPKGTRVLVGHFAGSFQRPHRRIAMCLGIPPDVDRATFYSMASKARGAMLKPVGGGTGGWK